MNSDDLALFALVANDLSISRAALTIGLDQSTVSRRIGLLEAQLGGHLFRRSGHGVKLTESGRLLLEYAQRVARIMEEASEVIGACSRTGPARLCIAAQPTIARMLFGTFSRALRERYPATRIRLIEGLAAQILPMMEAGEVDLSVLYVPECPGGLHWEKLLHEDVRLITPWDHPLEGGSVDVRDLGEIPLILPTTHHGLRVLVERLAARHNFPLRIALECDGSISITKRLVRENCGCTILPSAAVTEDIASGVLKSFRLVNPEITRTVAATWPKKSLLPDDLSAILRLLRQCTETLVNEGRWPDARLCPATPVPAASFSEGV
ncbi:LysR substrate-binding domain-containing protein [Acetobacter fallax]|uniref:LysR family transcriptional regulator n=1 Tax=Acetobacter fallax TaxID=1737473 RepID=A0ABX0K9S0_9PROT|nr:LysR family transcriptional regulator [Acetobacter fallax]NHO35280.1 LysR family transcriptional regulator [Acetobacter fallax]